MRTYPDLTKVVYLPLHKVIPLLKALDKYPAEDEVVDDFLKSIGIQPPPKREAKKD